MFSKDADADVFTISEWIFDCVDLVRTEGVANIQDVQKTGGVRKRLNQVDCDRPDVRGIP